MYMYIRIISQVQIIIAINYNQSLSDMFMNSQYIIVFKHNNNNLCYWRTYYIGEPTIR